MDSPQVEEDGKERVLLGWVGSLSRKSLCSSSPHHCSNHCSVLIHNVCRVAEQGDSNLEG